MDVAVLAMISGAASVATLVCGFAETSWSVRGRRWVTLALFVAGHLGLPLSFLIDDGQAFVVAFLLRLLAPILYGPADPRPAPPADARSVPLPDFAVMMLQYAALGLVLAACFVWSVALDPAAGH